MLFELKDYGFATEYTMKYNHQDICLEWVNETSLRHVLNISDSGCTVKYRLPGIWHMFERVEINGCTMFIYQDLNRNNPCMLLVPEFSSKTGKVTWEKIHFEYVNNDYYKYVYVYKNGIILANDQNNSMKIVMHFSQISYTHNCTKYTTTVPTIVSKNVSDYVPTIDYTISLIKDPTIVDMDNLPRHLVQESYHCYQYGEYYIYGGYPWHLLVCWDLKYVKYMSKQVRHYIQCILLSIQRKSLYKLVPKILWTKYILPIVVFHMPNDSKGSCVVF